VADVLPLGPAPAGAFLAPRYGTASAGGSRMAGGMLLVRVRPTLIALCTHRRMIDRENHLPARSICIAPPKVT
jgi:hypothetical protein